MGRLIRTINAFILPAAGLSPKIPHRWFFPAAAVYAALALPVSVLAMQGSIPGPAALANPLGHAHEMLVGFALGVVAGYQLPLMARSRLIAMFGLWLAGRALFLAFPASLATSAADIAFALILAAHIAPRLFVAAKKLRNLALPLVLSGLCVAAALFDAFLYVALVVPLQAVVLAFVLLLCALMLFMGGRILAPAVAGQFYRQGQNLAARVQPRIEAALLILVGIAIVATGLPASGVIARAACIAAGIVAVVRLARWRIWECRGRPDLACLGVGYAWLALGLVALGASETGPLRTAAIHCITVGALGTLTFNVMAGTVMLRARLERASEPRLVWGTALIAAAAVLRIGAAIKEATGTPAPVVLFAAAACWSAAFLVLVWLLADALRVVRTPHPPSVDG
ncbi:MAG TPA: NnrS family protein [Casimicrobiaceae bacterium]|nr:NnrS family protein [Casimicrobiaceae bacterium]